MSGLAPSSTFFTEPPHWQWLIIFYFFIGGLAGGTYVLAALIDFFGRTIDRPLARLGYYVAFPATVVSGLLLIVDLTRPLRFWHMLLESNTWQPMLKTYSPMSVGSWALLLFGAVTLVSFLAALGDAGRLRWRWLARLRPPTIAGGLVAVVGAALGFFIASYTGVLLAVTNRPIWSDTTVLGLNFLLSSASTSAALLVLLAWFRWRVTFGIHALERFDAWVLVVELLALIALVVSLGEVARVWLGAWGALLLVGVVILGIVLPLVLLWRTLRFTRAGVATAVASVLVLVGGFIFRIVVVLSSEQATRGMGA